MILEDFLQTMGDGALLVATPAVIAFTIRYGIWSYWRETAPGRAVFWLSAALSSLVVLVVWAVIDRLMGWDTSFVRDFYRVFAYGFTMVCCWRLLITLLKIQEEGRKNRKARLRLNQEQDQTEGSK